jgi:hypothetical protein
VREQIDPGGRHGEFMFYWSGPAPFDGTYPNPTRTIAVRESCEGRKPEGQS